MTNLQLDLNIENFSEDEIKFINMQKQIDMMNDSMGKVRRKLFAEMTILKKELAILVMENEELKKKLNEANQKSDWIYGENECLFLQMA